jgi:hypothetical protein
VKTRTCSWGHARSAAGAALLLATIVSSATGPPLAVVAQHATRPNYVFETLFNVRAEALPAFDRYWSTLKEIDADGGGPLRFVDAAGTGTSRRVTLPVVRLAEYSFDRRNEGALRAALGEDAAATLIQQFNDAQISRAAYLRQYRHDLGLGRDVRARTTEVAFVTVLDGKQQLFERAWRRVAEAHRRLDPNAVVSVAQTLVGGGPQFVIAQPVHEDAGRSALRLTDPIALVREAAGQAAATEVAELLTRSGASWRVETYRNLGFDTSGHGHDTHRP